MHTQGGLTANGAYDVPGHDENRPIPQVQAAAANVIRKIEITQLNHGYIVTVGCQTFAIESAPTLIAKLSEYISNPAVTEDKWHQGKLF